jgi:hypothetical protein
VGGDFPSHLPDNQALEQGSALASTVIRSRQLSDHMVGPCSRTAGAPRQQLCRSCGPANNQPARCAHLPSRGAYKCVRGATCYPRHATGAQRHRHALHGFAAVMAGACVQPPLRRRPQLLQRRCGLTQPQYPVVVPPAHEQRSLCRHERAVPRTAGHLMRMCV